ncbi:hypothetical protein, partial [Salipiger marinus]|uniref:hypothetical protein n=1 Tax=Salipiger marinus TaxID=555512 RepID=UPI001E59BCCD
MAHVEALVRLGVYALEVVESVVGAIVVAVVDLETVRNRPVCGFPHKAVLSDQAAVVLDDKDISRRADEACAWGLRILELCQALLHKSHVGFIS